MKNQTVIGVFDTKNQATEAREALVSAGFSSSDIDFSAYGENGVVGDSYRAQSETVTGFFGDLYGQENANRYANVASRGTVVTVHTATMDQAKQAASILDQYGAIDFNERATMYESKGYNDYTAELDSDTIKVIEENIAVGKREVVTGGATVRARVIEKPVTETLRLREEHVYIKRTPVDRPATAADFAEGTISVTETAEEAVVAKSARVVEEIEVGKEVNTRTETINETVRETEVDVVETEGEVVRTYDQQAKLTNRS